MAGDEKKREGKFLLKIAYNPTEGNIEIHKRFTESAWKNSDGSYILELQRLLDFSEIYKYLDDLHARISVLETILFSKEEKKEEKKVKPEVKTFGGA